MASPKLKPSQRSKTQPSSHTGSRVPPPRHTSTPAAEPEVVEPIWLVKAIGLTLAASLVCAYLALCLLFYQGQWQLVLHPSKRSSAEVNLPGVTSEAIHFGIDESATPQLNGIYIPAAAGARYGSVTLLYLPSGDGQLADASATLRMLHDLGLNVFAFDYRGYGSSLRLNPSQSHPTEQRMTEDAASAWQYLTVSRGLRASQIVPFGVGVGASVAAGLAERHAEVPALVVDAPVPDLLAVVRRDPRTGSLPVRALFHERFEIIDKLTALKTPKLLILPQLADDSASGEAAGLQALARRAAEPKFTLSLGANSSAAMLPVALGRFLDQYVRP